MSEETKRLKARLEHELAIGKLTVGSAFDRVEEAVKEETRNAYEHFGNTQAREAQKRPWVLPLLIVGLPALGALLTWFFLKL